MHTLLLIDDNVAVQRMVELAFHDEAVSIVIARSIDEAVRQMTDAPPSVILADEALPVASFLKSNPQLASIPLVLLRGAFAPADSGVERAEVLKKPIHPDLLLARVRSLLGLAQSRAPAVPSDLMAPEPSLTMDHGLPLDEYFDQLAAAFSKVNAPSRPVDLNDPEWPFARTSRVEPAAPPPPKPQEVKAIQPRPIAPDASMAISEELVDRIAQQVIDRMGDKLVRATVTDIVSRLAKWLVADEVGKVEKKAKAR
jgi:CheY-like chemotaxis protein